MAFDAATFGADDSGSVTLNVSHTATGANRYALVYVFQWDDTAINSVTYNGVSMGAALLREVSGGTSRVLSVYGMVAPPTGAQNVLTTFAANPTISAVMVLTYTGIAQTSTVTAVDGDYNDSTSPISLAISSNTTDTVVAAGYMSSDPMAAGGSQTARITQQGFLSLGRSLMVSDKAGATPTQSMSYTSTGTFEDNLILSISLAAAAGGGAYTLTSEQGSYGLTGQEVTLLAGGFISAESGSYTLLGSEGLRDISSVAEQGSYAMNGQATGLIRAAKTTAQQGSYSLLGQAVSLIYSAGSAGLSAFLKRGRRMFGFRLGR